MTDTLEPSEGMVLRETLTVTKTVTVEGEAAQLLNDLYDKIWVEAFYDPDCVESQEYAENLMPTIRRLNEILRFKK